MIAKLAACDVVIRPMTVDDIHAVEQLEARAGSHRWPAGAYRHELEVNPHAAYFVAIRNGTGDDSGAIVGFAGLWIQFDEVHISQMAVDPDCRRRGIAARLLVRLIDHALAAGAAWLTLEVRAGNEAAKGLYRRFGFEVVGDRRAYYADNDEDALIMTTPALDDPTWRARVEALRAGP